MSLAEISESAAAVAADLDQRLITVSGRPDPRRLDSELYPIHVESRSRYGDMDPNAHLNNLALESFHEDARATANRLAFPVEGRTLRYVVSQHTVHFLTEVFWPSTIRTGIGVGRLGRTSFVMSSGSFVDGRCVSLCDTVMVALDDDGPHVLTDSERAQLSRHRLGAPHVDLS